MNFDVISLFPAMFSSPIGESILGKALERGLISFEAHNLRDWATGRHQVTDDAPYGGGNGMLLKPEPVFAAVEEIRSRRPASKVVMLTPQGKRFDQREASELASCDGLIFLCGRYEGFDERIRQNLVDLEYSIGDYVLTGGELGAMVMIDAVSRLLPGVLGGRDSACADSFSDGLLEHPHYTRPAEFRGMSVPEILLSGDHGRIARWRREQQLERTLARRPDLLDSAPLSDEDRRFLDGLKQSGGASRL